MRKTISKIAFPVVLGLLISFFISCDKHDFFDENLITGNVGPQAYWELGSSTVTARTNVPFTVQYYSTVSDIDYSEVWCGITEVLYKKVTCPWVTSFTYSYTSEIQEEKRISQKIEEFPHVMAVWSDSLRAYTFDGEFPVSGTLSSFSWNKPSEFDSIKMTTYFGEEFMQQFKDSLYDLMQFADFQKMLLGLELLDDFKIYTDSTENPNAGEGKYTYHFPMDADGNTPVPQGVQDMYTGITFDRLIEGSSGYEVEYKRSYLLNAIMRVYDVRGVYGTTTSKEVTIN